MKCPRIHRYVIAMDHGDSTPYDTPEAAREFKSNLPEDYRAIWVAFHQVGVEQLVNNPTTVQTYCEPESHHQEDLDLKIGFQEQLSEGDPQNPDDLPTQEENIISGIGPNDEDS